MQYLNPFHFFHESVSEETVIDKTTLRRLKKQVLTEFELQGVPTILIAQKEYDKNAVLKFFDRLTSEDALKLHLKVYRNEPLLDFLEKGDLTFFKMPDAVLELANDKDLFPFVMPYFVQNYNMALFDAVRKMDIRLARLLSKSAKIFPQEQEGTAFQKTYRHLKAKVLDIESVAKRIRKEYVLDSEIDPFLHPSFMTVFNSLPAPFFDRIRNEFALQLETLALNLHNISRRTSMAVEALEAGLELDVSANTKHRLNHVLKQLLSPKQKQQREKDTGKTKTRTSERNKAWDIATIAFWIVQIIIFLWLLLRLM